MGETSFQEQPRVPQMEQLASREIVEVFERLGFPLNERLLFMLQGAAEFCCCTSSLDTESMGGYLEATRYLAQTIRFEREDDIDRDLEALFKFSAGVFREREQRILNETGSGGRVAASLLLPTEDREQIVAALDTLSTQANRILRRMIRDILLPVKDESLPTRKAVREYFIIGACKKAELNFLLALKKPIENGAVLFDKDGTILAWQKEGMGQPTFITFKDILLNGIRLPPGSLLCCRPTQETLGSRDEFSFNRSALTIEDIKDIRFLRLTTLAIPPEERESALGSLLIAQKSFGFPAPDTATLADVYQRVQEYAASL